MDQSPITDGTITIGGAAQNPQGNSQTTAVQAATTQQAQQQPASAQPAAQTSATPTPPPPPASTQKSDDSGSLFDKFDIPEAVRANHPKLVPLILETESMSDDERQYWFQILPIMTDDQVKKLHEILINEKQQLAEIDKQYNKEVKQINEKHVSEWKEFEHKDKRERLKTEESKTEQSEKEKEEQLMAQLNNL